MADDTEAITARLSTLGFADKTIKDALKNQKHLTSLLSVLDEAESISSSNDASGMTRDQLVNFNALAVASKDTPLPNRHYITTAISDGRLKSSLQVEAAIKYVKETPGEISSDEFNKATGVGIEFTKEQVVDRVKEYILERKEEIEEQRYKVLGSTIANIKATTDLKWANALDVKQAVDAEFLSLLGPKDERDVVKKVFTTSSL